LKSTHIFEFDEILSKRIVQYKTFLSSDKVSI
jgi:predicted HTH domain antitoxin